MPEETPEPEFEPKLGDHVAITGTVRKNRAHWGHVGYQDAGVPGFHGYAWKDGPSETFSPRAGGVIVGKRRYRSMENDEGIWVPDGAQDFTAYLVSWHLSRQPVIVRLDQMTGAPTPSTGTQTESETER